MRFFGKIGKRDELRRQVGVDEPVSEPENEREFKLYSIKEFPDSDCFKQLCYMSYDLWNIIYSSIAMIVLDYKLKIDDISVSLEAISDRTISPHLPPNSRCFIFWEHQGETQKILSSIVIRDDAFVSGDFLQDSARIFWIQSHLLDFARFAKSVDFSERIVDEIGFFKFDPQRPDVSDEIFDSLRSKIKLKSIAHPEWTINLDPFEEKMIARKEKDGVIKEITIPILGYNFDSFSKAFSVLEKEIA